MSFSKQARDPMYPFFLGGWDSKENDGFSLLDDREIHIFTLPAVSLSHSSRNHTGIGNCRTLLVSVGFPRRALFAYVKPGEVSPWCQTWGWCVRRGCFHGTLHSLVKINYFQVSALFLSQAKTNCSISGNWRDFSVTGHRQSQPVHRLLIIGHNMKRD